MAKVAEAEPDEQTRRRPRPRSGRCDLIVNTPQGSGARADGYRIREAALTARVPCITTISGAAAAVHAIANARAETALSLQERIGARRVTGPTLGASGDASCSGHRRRAGRPLHAAPRRARRARAGHSRAVLHAPSAGARAAAPDVALPRAGGRARVPDRPDRARHAGAVRPRAGRRARRARAHSATASTSTSSARCSSAAGSGSPRCPYCRAGARRRRRPCSGSGPRTTRRRPRSCRTRRSCSSPTFVTDAAPDDPGDVLACGPEPMLEAVAALVAGRTARLGGADGLRLRRVLRLRRRDRGPAAAALRRRPGAPRPREAT